MIAKTEAIVLRVAPFSETSHVVTWLAKDLGRLVTVIKGAQRPKSPFLGQYDLFYTCELLFYTRPRNGLYIAKESTPLQMRTRFRTDWKACATASYIADLVYRVSLDAPHGHDIFPMTVHALDFAAVHQAHPQLVLWFELHLQAALGVAPQLGACSSCGCHAQQSSAPATFSPANGGLICAACTTPHAPTERVAPDVLAIMRAWQNAPTAAQACRTKCTATQLRRLAHLIGLFQDYHLDIHPPSRYITLQMLLGPTTSVEKTL